jgi:hypothetical protein
LVVTVVQQFPGNRQQQQAADQHQTGKFQQVDDHSRQCETDGDGTEDAPEDGFLL